MSPEIILVKNGTFRKSRTVIDLPDVSGTFETELGALEIDMTGIDSAKNGPQTVTLEADFLKGDQRGNGRYGPTRRMVNLSHRGVGSHMIDSQTKLIVRLHQEIRPTRHNRRNRY